MKAKNHDVDLTSVHVSELEVKICDFGFSRIMPKKPEDVLSPPTLSPEVCTKGYKAPEMDTGKYGKEADVYSAGIICFELEYKRLPNKIDDKKMFEDKDVSKYERVDSVLKKMLKVDPPKIRPTADEARAIFALSADDTGSTSADSGLYVTFRY